MTKRTSEVNVKKKVYEIKVAKRSFTAQSPSILYSLKVEFITLLQSHIDAKRVNQAFSRSGDIMFDIVGAPTQRQGIDYNSGINYVSWSGLELEQILSVGDVVRLAYLSEV